MDYIAILWNSMNDNVEEAITDINEYANVYSYVNLDLGDNFSYFVQDIYGYMSDDEKWKLDYKLENTIHKYSSTTITIIFLTIPNEEKILDERKNKLLYKEANNLKKLMRTKYSKKVEHYAFDNVFHMTDDKDEYLSTLKLIRKYTKKSDIVKIKRYGRKS